MVRAEPLRPKRLLCQEPEPRRLQADRLPDALECGARHQAVLSAIRESGRQNIDPIRFGEPWPKGFFEAIERRTVALQDYFDKEIGRIKNSG